MTEVRYPHECSACVFLERYEGCDLYLCRQPGELPVVVARHGDARAACTYGVALTAALFEVNPARPLARAIEVARLIGLLPALMDPVTALGRNPGIGAAMLTPAHGDRRPGEVAFNRAWSFARGDSFFAAEARAVLLYLLRHDPMVCVRCGGVLAMPEYAHCDACSRECGSCSAHGRCEPDCQRAWVNNDDPGGSP